MSQRPQNAFLLKLTDAAFALLAVQLSPVELTLSARVQKADFSSEWVYFPVKSLLSMIAFGHPGQGVETSMIGSEGAAGLIEACGSGASAVDCVVQVGGPAWRAPSFACRALATASPNFAETSWRAAELQVAEIRQSGVCHALHSIEQRLARWLLESLERSGMGPTLPMTQQFLSVMLGVQRTTISALASRMQNLGVIRYSRGHLTVTDVGRLEHLACGCRRAMQDQRTRLGFPAVPPALR